MCKLLIANAIQQRAAMVHVAENLISSNCKFFTTVIENFNFSSQQDLFWWHFIVIHNLWISFFPTLASP